MIAQTAQIEAQWAVDRDRAEIHSMLRAQIKQSNSIPIVPGGA